MAAIVLTEYCVKVILENQLFGLNTSLTDVDKDIDKFVKETLERIDATKKALEDFDKVCQARDAVGGHKILGPGGIDLSKLKGGG